MTLDEIRQEWLRQSKKMSAEVLKSYDEHKIGSGGREGLGVYGMYQQRIARKNVQIAVKLLGQNGVEPTTSNIHKITRQSRSTIQRYMPAHVLKAHERQRLDNMSNDQLAEVIRLRPS
jgi:folylpolyglutamate synthase/dihydropteroate synthase